MAEANKPEHADSDLGLMHDGHLSALAVQLLPWLPLSLGLLVATLASLPVLGQWAARVGHWRLFWNGLERMVQPVWAALTSPTALFVATGSALVLCLLVLVPLQRLSAGEVNG